MWAACTPAARASAPPPGATVTCSGTAIDQNAPIGYGTGNQDGLTINVLIDASVTSAPTILR
jgi:hypothetical protein